MKITKLPLFPLPCSGAREWICCATTVSSPERFLKLSLHLEAFGSSIDPWGNLRSSSQAIKFFQPQRSILRPLWFPSCRRVIQNSQGSRSLFDGIFDAVIDSFCVSADARCYVGVSVDTLRFCYFSHGVTLARSSLAQPSPAQSSPALPSPAQSSSVRPSPAMPFARFARLDRRQFTHIFWNFALCFHAFKT